MSGWWPSASATSASLLKNFIAVEQILKLHITQLCFMNVSSEDEWPEGNYHDRCSMSIGDGLQSVSTYAQGRHPTSTTHSVRLSVGLDVFH